MAEWRTELKCKQCGHELALGQISGTIICSNCQKQYSLILSEASYAVAESYSCDYFDYGDDDTIHVRSFNNPPLDTLEEAYQDTVALYDNETNPPKLLNVVKKYHDSLKMAVRRLIELNPGNLSRDQLQRIVIDDIGNQEKSLNIKNLSYFLNCAFPHRRAEIENCFKQNEDMIKRIWWVRNKMEHILYSQWPICSKVFQDLDKNPGDPEIPQDTLNCDFIKRTNHAVIDIYNLILNLRPTQPEQWQIDAVDLYRLQ